VTLTMMVGAIVHSLIVGQVINEVTSDNTVNVFLKNKLKLAKEFAIHANLAPEGTKALSFWLEQNVRDLMTQQYKMDEMHQLITNDMPLSLMKELHSRLYHGQLGRNRFLRVPFVIATPPRLPLLLSLALTPKCYETGQLLYQSGDAAFHMYLVLSGTFAFVARPERATKSPRASEMWPYQLFSHSSYFGNFELHSGLKQFRRTTARCESEFGQALRLQREHYHRLCGEFPQFAGAWNYEAQRREALRVRLLSQHTKMHNYRILAARRVQKYVRQRWKLAREAILQGEVSPREVQPDICMDMRRTSWHSSSGEASETLASLSIGSVCHQRSDNNVVLRHMPGSPADRMGIERRSKMEEELLMRQQQLQASVTALKASAEVQAEQMEQMRRDLRYALQELRRPSATSSMQSTMPSTPPSKRGSKSSNAGKASEPSTRKYL